MVDDCTFWANITAVFFFLAGFGVGGVLSLSFWLDRYIDWFVEDDNGTEQK